MNSFLAPVKHLRFSENVGKGLLVQGAGDPSIHDIRVTNDPGTIVALLTQSLREAMGELHIREIESSDAVLYVQAEAFSSINDESEVSEQEYRTWLNIGHHLAESILNRFNSFSMCLWAMADSCAYADRGYIETYLRPNRMINSTASTTAVFFDSTGGSRSVEFSREDWDRAVALSQCWHEALAKARAGTPAETRDISEEVRRVMETSPVDNRSSTVSGTSVTRLSRFYYFLQSARGAFDLCIRVSLYFTALEALFISKGTGELVHRIAERVACFLDHDGDSRIECFNFVKRAYNVRSKTVHGSNITKPELASLQETAKRLDYLMRRVFGCLLSEPEVLNVFLGSPDDIDNYFLRKVLY